MRIISQGKDSQQSAEDFAQVSLQRQTTMDDLNTIDTIAERMGVSRRSVERLIERGELRAVTLPTRHRRVLESDYQAFLATLAGHQAPVSLAARRRRTG